MNLGVCFYSSIYFNITIFIFLFFIYGGGFLLGLFFENVGQVLGIDR